MMRGGGAAYDADGLCGILFCPKTNMRAESPVINTTGFSNLTLTFDFISMGDALIDNASVWYNDGLGWTLLAPSIKSVNCLSGQGQWTAASFVFSSLPYVVLIVLLFVSQPLIFKPLNFPTDPKTSFF